MKAFDIIYKTLIETFDLCERKGFLKYMFMGHGIEPAYERGFALAKGTSIHKGIETIWKTGDIDKAVAAAFSEYDYEMHDVTWAGVDPAIVDAWHKEHHRCIEGVLRLWHKVRYPKLLSEFDVVNTEYRVLVPLNDRVKSLAIPDCIFKAKLDGRFVNWSLKTEKAHSYMKHPAALIDIGGLTEAIAAAASVGDGQLRNIAGTMMEYLVVGKMDDNEPIIWHPAIRGWRREKDTGGYEYAWRYKFDNPDYDPQGPKNPKKNPKTRSLGEKGGWSRFLAEEYPDGGLQGWIDALVSRQFLPLQLDPVDELILAPHPYTRSESNIESFVKQIVTKHQRWTTNRAALEAGEIDLDQAFEQRRRSCMEFARKCEYWGICWEGQGVDPLNLGYQIRKTSLEREKARAAYDALQVASNNKPEDING